MIGYYYDPLHGNCLRRITHVGKHVYKIDGVYGDDENTTTAQTGDHWFAHIVATPKDDDTLSLRVDFCGKPIKSNRFMMAEWKDRRIYWDDGNVWIQLYTTPRQLDHGTDVFMIAMVLVIALLVATHYTLRKRLRHLCPGHPHSM
jgi:hypothetical protein